MDSSGARAFPRGFALGFRESTSNLGGSVNIWAFDMSLRTTTSAILVRNEKKMIGSSPLNFQVGTRGNSIGRAER